MADLSVFVPQALPSNSVDPAEERKEPPILADDPDITEINKQI